MFWSYCMDSIPDTDTKLLQDSPGGTWEFDVDNRRHVREQNFIIYFCSDFCRMRCPSHNVSTCASEQVLLSVYSVCQPDWEVHDQWDETSDMSCLLIVEAKVSLPLLVKLFDG